MPDGVTNGLSWLIEGLLQGHALDAPVAISSLRQQLDDLMAEQEKMAPVSPPLQAVAEKYAALNERLWGCLDRVEDGQLQEARRDLQLCLAELEDADDEVHQVDENTYLELSA